MGSDVSIKMEEIKKKESGGFKWFKWGKKKTEAEETTGMLASINEDEIQ